MAYTKTTWSTGDVITADKLNNIEAGIEEAHSVTAGANGVTPDITVEANVDNGVGTPSVEVVESGTVEEPIFTLNFSNLKGDTGATGATPVVSATASVGEDLGEGPTASVTVGGTTEAPELAFTFTDLKGDPGDTGATGATPSITASAVMGEDDEDGPAVSIEKSGTDEEPHLTFTFKNLKGEDGAAGTEISDVEVTVDDQVGTPEGSAYIQDGTLYLDFKNLKGETGAAGSSSGSVVETLAITSVVVNTDGLYSETPVTSGDYSDGVLTLTLNGLRGAPGEDGDDGDTPVVSASATLESDGGDADVSVEKSGTDAEPSFAFTFKNLEGTKISSVDVQVDDQVGTPQGSGYIQDGVLYLNFNNLKGETGATGGEGGSLTINTVSITLDGSYSATPSGTGNYVSESGTLELNFTGLRGEPGATGATPVVSASATVGEDLGEGPTASVTVSGTTDAPELAFTFTDLKGDTGATGATPVITASAVMGEDDDEGPGVSLSQAGTDEAPELTFTFKNLKGATGDTPSITAQVSADEVANVGTPSVEVATTGTAEEPVMTFTFANLKGEQGIQGETGATPVISASASYGTDDGGSPDVEVTTGGTDEAPSLAFVFKNLVGATGAEGRYVTAMELELTDDVVTGGTLTFNDTSTVAIQVNRITSE